MTSSLLKWGEAEKAVARRECAGQIVKLTCGVDGCRRKWEGRWGELLKLRDRHRRRMHPNYIAPKRGRQKAAKTRRYDGGWEDSA